MATTFVWRGRIKLCHVIQALHSMLNILIRDTGRDTGLVPTYGLPIGRHMGRATVTWPMTSR